MDLNSRNLKVILGSVYLIFLFVGLYFLFSMIDLKDLTNYNFIKSNRDTIFLYKSENFLLLSLFFFLFCIVWVLFLGFASPLLIFSGFVFGKWWGFFIVLFATTLGATLLYYFAGLFLKNFIKEKLTTKFSRFIKIFKKNETLYFMCFRFIGGTPYAIQNVLPIIFDMRIKNYFLATLLGSVPSMFVMVALGSGIENVIDENESLNFFGVLTTPNIYIPLIGFFIILISAIIIKKIFFNTDK